MGNIVSIAKTALVHALYGRDKNLFTMKVYSIVSANLYVDGSVTFYIYMDHKYL